MIEAKSASPSTAARLSSQNSMQESRKADFKNLTASVRGFNGRDTERSVRVCCYGSSSTATPQKYLNEAYNLGALIAKDGNVCVNGGGRTGCMGAVNTGTRDFAGKIVSVIHNMWVVDGGDAFADVDELIVCYGDDLQERKKKLLDNSDCVLVLPGGPGTFDEFAEMVCCRQLGFTNKPLIVVNVDGYYNGIISQFKKFYDEGLMRQRIDDLMLVAADSQEAYRIAIDAVKRLPRHVQSEHNTRKVRPVNMTKEAAALAVLSFVCIVQLVIIAQLAIASWYSV